MAIEESGGLGGTTAPKSSAKTTLAKAPSTSKAAPKIVKAPAPAAPPPTPEPVILDRPAILQLEYQPVPTGAAKTAEVEKAPQTVAGWLSAALGAVTGSLIPSLAQGTAQGAAADGERRFQTGALGSQSGAVEATGRPTATELQGQRYQLMAEQAYTGQISPRQLNVIAGVPERGGLTRGQLADAARLSAQAIAYGQWPNIMSPQVASFMGLPLDLWSQLYEPEYPYRRVDPATPGGTSGTGSGSGRRGTSGGRGGRASTPSAPYLGLTNWRI